jgi:hypothetical protein
MTHTWPREFFIAHSRTGSRLLLGFWWWRVQHSECCQIFANYSSWLSILILWASINCKVTNLENKEPAEAYECPRNSWTDVPCMWLRSKDPIVCNFHSNLLRPLPQKAQDFASLWHPMVQIIYGVPRENRPLPWFFICLNLIASVFCPVCIIPYSVSEFQGRIRKSNFRHLFLPE